MSGTIQALGFDRVEVFRTTVISATWREQKCIVNDTPHDHRGHRSKNKTGMALDFGSDRVVVGDSALSLPEGDNPSIYRANAIASILQGLDGDGISAQNRITVQPIASEPHQIGAARKQLLQRDALILYAASAKFSVAGRRDGGAVAEIEMMRAIELRVGMGILAVLTAVVTHAELTMRNPLVVALSG